MDAELLVLNVEEKGLLCAGDRLWNNGAGGRGVYIFDGNKPPAKCSQLLTRVIGISATTTVSHEIELLGYVDGCIDTVQVFTMFVQTKRLEYVLFPGSLR